MIPSNTICVSQEGPANALALNKDASQVVIAGRNGIYQLPWLSFFITYPNLMIKLFLFLHTGLFMVPNTLELCFYCYSLQSICYWGDRVF